MDRNEFDAELRAVARKGADVIRGRRAQGAAARAVNEALHGVVALLLGLLIARAAGVQFTLMQALGWPLAIGALWIPIRAAAASVHRVAHRPSLMEVDRQLELKDRLTTAQEFMGNSSPTPFMVLALQDARDHVERAREATLQGDPSSWSMSRRERLLLAVAVTLVAILGYTVTSAAASDDVDDRAPVVVASGDADPDTQKPPARPDDPTPPKDEVKEDTPAPQGGAPARPSKESAPPTREVKKSQGKTGLGRSADAASSSGKGRARGTPSSQGQSSKSGKKPKPKKKSDPKKRPDKAQEADKERKPEEQSGQTAGRGAASGSNKSPAASQWSSKDQVTSDDEEDLEDDEEVDDEFDNSDARGGLQPALRDRKPPVNRDLGIGFGNMSNPDANGRGGPGERKKSRGVASLVLGVPIPDHIKGRPNPGKTKITQERVEPQEEEIAADAARPRSPRGAPAGHLTTPELAPWMQDLLRTYFGSLRKTKRDSP